MPAQVHWKTGTSFGHRDAWAAGSGPRHTAVVWLGNIDNAPSVHLVGADAAGPLLFDLLEAVGPRGRASVKEEPVAPQDLTLVEVCAYSGHLPTDACKERKQVYARRSAVPTEPCPYHQKVEVDAKTGLAVSPACRAGREVESRVYLTWPASIRRWLTEQHRSLPTPPAYAPGCEPGGAEHAPEILSPAEGQVALLIPGVSPDQQEVPAGGRDGARSRADLVRERQVPRPARRRTSACGGRPPWAPTTSSSPTTGASPRAGGSSSASVRKPPPRGDRESTLSGIPTVNLPVRL